LGVHACIVIVGGGAGGLPLAARLGDDLGRRRLADITGATRPRPTGGNLCCMKWWVGRCPAKRAKSISCRKASRHPVRTAGGAGARSRGSSFI